MSPAQPDPRPSEPASLKASLPEDADSSARILERLRLHGAQTTRYAQRGEVARGGMGMILRVWDEDLRRELAMKVVLGESGQATTGEIAPKMLGRFLEEAQVTGQLDHPGVVPVHELGLDERGAVFFTMRLVKGRDLKEIFERVQAGDEEWTQTRVLWVLLKVCDAMAYAHSKGVIHRDLKPANVMVGRFGEVYVMDWGLARVLGQPDRHDLRLRNEEPSLSFVESERRADASHSTDSLLFTMDGDVVGTPAYMSPEQARGEIEHLGPHSDVYALGAMLYHLLSGEMPYISPGARVSQHMVLRWVLEGPPRPLHELRPDVPEELAAICEKAMARDTARRYPDMGALGEDLRAYLENRVVKAHRSGAWVEFRKWVQRNRGLALAWGVAVFVALLGLSTTAWVQVRGRREAVANLEEAQRQAEIAKRERSNVLRLSAFQDLDELERDADTLWPAVPARIPALRDWLARAERLVAGLEPGADGEPGHRAQLAALRERATVLDPAERSRRIEAHPRGAELRRLEREVDALRTARDVRRGRAQPAEAEPDPEALTGSWQTLNDRALALVSPTREEFGHEPEGLALARLALEEVPAGLRYMVLDTLAWAAFANGLDDEAQASSLAALEGAPASQRPQFEELLTRVVRAVQEARSPAGEAALADAERRLEDLEREVVGVPRLSFAGENDRWWYGQLVKLVAALEDFADPDQGLVEGLSPVHGWGVRRRLEYASALEERSLTGSDARARWDAARQQVRASSAYAGLELAPQLGLLPLGADPDSGLQEFADLATGEPPWRDGDGDLVLSPASSVVFVLVPGGQALTGAQARDEGGPNYDPMAGEEESPVSEVRLDPFLLSKYELTQGQWERFTGRRPSKQLAGTVVAGCRLTPLSPVEQVDWFEATRELARLGWVLPTEVQWEYAARAGTESPWWTGDEVLSLEGASNLSDRFAHQHGAPWASFEDELDDRNLAQAPVGSFLPNPFGLHDVIGNVNEWCRDAFADYGQSADPGDGLRPSGDSATRMVRGGSYVSPAANVRSSRRDSAPPQLKNEILGLRPARRLDP